MFLTVASCQANMISFLRTRTSDFSRTWRLLALLAVTITKTKTVVIREIKKTAFAARDHGMPATV